MKEIIYHYMIISHDNNLPFILSLWVLPRDAMLARWSRGIYSGTVSVRLSVHLFITSQSSTKKAKPRILLIVSHSRPELSFSDAKHLREIRPGCPIARAPCAGGISQNRRLRLDRLFDK